MKFVVSVAVLAAGYAALLAHGELLVTVGVIGIHLGHLLLGHGESPVRETAP